MFCIIIKIYFVYYNYSPYLQCIILINEECYLNNHSENKMKRITTYELYIILEENNIQNVFVWVNGFEYLKAEKDSFMKKLTKSRIFSFEYEISDNTIYITSQY